MIPLREVAVLDRNAEALGVATKTLMEHAGKAVADEVVRRYARGGIAVLVGPGNNGGDGAVAARLLAAAGRDVTLVLSHPRPKTALARAALEAVPPAVKRITAEGHDDDRLDAATAKAAVIVDALLGAGGVAAPRGEVARLVAWANRCGKPLVAVDVPTGLGSSTPIRPEATVTLHDVKEGMDADNSGDIVVADIGVPERAATHTGPGEFALYPHARPDQHKGQAGFVLVVGGGPYTGAPALCAMAAMAMGADLAIILTPRPSWPVIASYSPNLVTRPLEGDILDLRRPANRVEYNRWLGMADCVLIGPGLGKFDELRDSVRMAVTQAVDHGVPIVLDADALWALSGERLDLKGRAVITPHAKEFQVLTGMAVARDDASRAEVARKAAALLGCTVLLKGPTDVIASTDRVKYSGGGVPRMSVGGTGDVLAGLTAALLGKKMDAFDAARVASYANKKAGEIAFGRRNQSLLATDVIDAIATVLATHLEQPDAAT